jgi:integrase
VSRLATPTSGRPERLDFLQFDPQFRIFAKTFLWLTEAVRDHCHRGARPVTSPRRFAETYRCLLAITQWMKREKVEAFGDITQAQYRDFIDEWVRRPRMRGTSQASRAKSTYAGFSAAFRRLHRFGPSELGLLPDGLMFDPAEAVEGLGCLRALLPKTGTAEMPEATARRLFVAALRWVDGVGPLLLPFVEKVRLLRAQPLKGNNVTKRKRTAKALLSDDRDDTLRKLWKEIPGEVVSAVLPPSAAQLTKTQALQWAAERPSKVVWPLVNLMTAACYSVMALLSGFRSSELLSIERKGLSRRGGRWRVTSTVFKTARARKGVRTLRPVPELFAAAHRLLVAHARVADIGYRTDRIFVGPRVPLSVIRTNPRLRRFARAHGIEWHITTHQFRKFFALFYVRRFRGPLDALRDHFRHLDREMILAYVGDAWGAKFLAEAEASLAAEVMDSIVLGASVGVEGDPAQGRYLATNLPPEEIERLAASNSAKALLAMEWGYCLLQTKSSRNQACGADTQKERDERRCPDVCGRCPLLAIGPENRARWTQTLLLHEEIVENPMSLPRMKAESRKMVSTAKELLAGLDAAGPTGARGRAEG